MNDIAFIFARGGSKGLPGKNIRPLCEKPLIAWSIEVAQSIPRIDRVIVSTDSEEIASIAKGYGAELPFIRPSSLAEDNSPEWSAWRHALSYILDSTGALPGSFISIPTTSPLRLPIDIENCIDVYEKGNADAVITVSDAHRNPYFNMVKSNVDGYIELVNKPSSNITQRQNAPDIFDMTTVCYVVNPQFVMEHNSIFEGRVKAVTVPVERAVDIDTLLDFEIAEMLLNKRISML